MKLQRIPAIVVLSALALLAVPSSAAARCPPACQLVRSLSITIAPQALTDVPVEHDVEKVHYTLTTKAYNNPDPVTGYVCAVSREDEDCKPDNSNYFPNVTGDATLSGAVFWHVPASDPHATAIIRFCQLPPVDPGRTCHGTSETPLVTPVAATYTVTLNTFTIDHTRAVHNDSLTATLLGETFDAGAGVHCRVGIPGPDCVQAALQGDQSGGFHPFKGMTIGPFTLVPGRTDGLRFGYAMLNFGDGSYGHGDFNALESQVSALLLGGLRNNVFTGDLHPVGSDFTDQINGLPWHGCDGPVAVQVVGLFDKGGVFSQDLRAQTDATGTLERDSPIFEFKSQTGCGFSPKYSTIWTVRRTSWSK
ncbi:MAG: hypothetical protein JOZ72_01100 [Alphaproteobacteria bacterium]|nr:hypothetical protein [Alphaproteobacteria bacterium]